MSPDWPLPCCVLFYPLCGLCSHPSCVLHFFKNRDLFLSNQMANNCPKQQRVADWQYTRTPSRVHKSHLLWSALQQLSKDTIREEERSFNLSWQQETGSPECLVSVWLAPLGPDNRWKRKKEERERSQANRNARRRREEKSRMLCTLSPKYHPIPVICPRSLSLSPNFSCSHPHLPPVHL